MTGALGATARVSAPRFTPCSSIQWSRPAWASVKGRRSSTASVTWFGKRRTMSARRMSGSASRRATTAARSRRKRLVPGPMPEAATTSSGRSRLAPVTATSVTVKRGEVSAHSAPSPPAPSTASAIPMGTAREVTHRTRRVTRRARRARETRCRSIAGPRSARSASRPRPARGEMTELWVLKSLPWSSSRARA